MQQAKNLSEAFLVVREYLWNVRPYRSKQDQEDNDVD